MAHHVIIIPALKTNSNLFEFLTRNWFTKSGLTVHVLNVWVTENDFPSMLKKVIESIDELSRNGDSVSLIGASGGGNLVINAFSERLASVNKVINVCGRLRIGSKNDLDYNTKDKQLKAYIESIKFFESKEKLFSDSDRKRIMTVRPKFGQEFVPNDTIQIEGAINISIPTIEHLLSIFSALTIFSNRLTNFLKQ